MSSYASYYSLQWLAFFLCSIPPSFMLFFFFNDTATTEIYTLSLHDALPILLSPCSQVTPVLSLAMRARAEVARPQTRSEEHTSELQSRRDLVCRLLLEKKKKKKKTASARIQKQKLVLLS